MARDSRDKGASGTAGHPKRKGAKRKYKTPLTSVEKMRLMRLITMFRVAIHTASMQEGADGRLEIDPKFQAEYVDGHRSLQASIWDEFPFIDIRGDRYASDLLDLVMQDAVYYVKHGDTPGGP